MAGPELNQNLRGKDINMVYLTDYSEKLDYYTPVLATNEEMIENDPETIKAFLKATSKGYQFTIDKPDQAADILIEAAPDLRSRVSEERVRNGYPLAIKMMRPAGENKNLRFGKIMQIGCLKINC